MRLKLFHVLLAGILLTLTWTTVCFGQVGSLIGDVRDLVSNNPIEEATVVLQNDTAWTNAQGTYTFLGIPVGTYSVTASKMGYSTETDTAEITPQDTVQLDFFLPPIPIIEIDISSLDVVIPPGEPHQETFNIINMGMGELTFDLNFTYEGMIPSILVVDDDGGSINNNGNYFDVHQFFTDALEAAELPFDFHVVDWLTSPEQPGPDVTIMEQYDLVIWFTGECWGIYGNDTITPTDELNLGQYLDGGGSLFFSSQDYFYVSYPGAGSFSPGQFPFDYLGVTYTDQDMWSPPSVCSGGPGSFADGMDFNLTVPYPMETLWTDMIQGNGIPLFIIEGQSAAQQYETANFKAAYTALSFEGLMDGTPPSTKAQFMENLANWVSGAAPTAGVPGGRNKTQLLETDEPWLTLSPEIGNIEPGVSQLITVNFQMPDTAEIGDHYEGNIVVVNNSLTDTIIIPVMVEMVINTVHNDPQSNLDFALYQNHPNPFNPTTIIKFRIQQTSHVNLSIYNILGQKVATLINRKINAGTHQITFDGSHLTSGMYFYQLQSGNYSDVKKMLLIQ